MDDAAVVASFESLGDNCEFGFVQRRHGVEPGGLLRWAIASPDALVRLLERRFDGLYDRMQVVPSSDDMVCDLEYGLYLHSRMRSVSTDGARHFIASESERDALHRSESEKIAHLTGKLIGQLDAADRIFVYKRNGGVSDAIAATLRDRLHDYNRRNVLLLVGVHGDVPAGTVWQAGEGLLRASIDRLAPYQNADDISDGCWLAICRQARAMAQSDGPQAAQAAPI